jgi:hypothetical protein
MTPSALEPIHQYQCCFCGNTIVQRAMDPVVLSLELPDDGLQQLYSHLDCLRERLHPNVPLGLDDEG